MKTANLVSAMFLGAALILTGCGSKNDQSDVAMGSRSGARSGDAGASTSSYTAAQLLANATWSDATGQITWDSTSNMSYDALIKNLLSATVVSNDGSLGSISNGGATFRGEINIQAGGSMDIAHSAIEILITTSVSTTPISLFIPGKSATITGNGSGTGAATLVFGDDYGTVTLVGNFDVNQNYSGTFEFENLANHNNDGQNHASGDHALKFAIQTCGFFVCY